MKDNIKAIFIEAGHGLSNNGNRDPGAVANWIVEREVVIDVARRLWAQLSPFQGKVKIYLIGVEEELNIPQKISQINEICQRKGYNHDNSLLLSLHVNAWGGTGHETFIWKQNEARTMGVNKIVNEPIATDISNAILNDLSNTFTGLRNRGVKGQASVRFGRLGIVVETTPLTILVELAFLDSPIEKELNMLRTARFLFADSLFTSLVNYFDLRVIKKEEKSFDAILNVFYNAIKELQELDLDSKSRGLRKPLVWILDKIVKIILTRRNK